MNVDVRQFESTSSGARGIASIVSAFASIGNSGTAGDDRAAATAADISTPFIHRKKVENRLVAKLRAAAEAASNPAVAQADEFWLLAAIRARKGSVRRALALTNNYFKWRASINADGLNLANCEKMRNELRRCVVFVAGNTDRDGRPIINVRQRNRDPSSFSAIDTTRMFSFVIEWTLRTYPAAQTHGMIFVIDMSDVGLRNIDLRMPGILQQAFSKTVPVRIAAFNGVHPPFFVRATFPLVQNVLSEKLNARVHIFPTGDEHRLHEFVAPDQLPDDIEGMDGTLSWTAEKHEAWIQRMMDDCQTWGPITSFKEES